MPAWRERRVTQGGAGWHGDNLGLESAGKPRSCSQEKKLVWVVSTACVWLQQGGSEDGTVTGNTRAVLAAPGLAGFAGGHKKPEPA